MSLAKVKLMFLPPRETSVMSCCFLLTRAGRCALALWLVSSLRPALPIRGDEASAISEEAALLQEPVAFRVYQRDEKGQAEIPVVLDPTTSNAQIVSARLSGLPQGALTSTDGKFRGVPTGGPYQVSATVKVGDTERTLTVGPFIVGDLWVLAGQSNMQGAG